MGILDVFRSKKKEHPTLPEPTPVDTDVKKIPSDLPVIKPPEETEMHEDIKLYPEPPFHEEITELHEVKTFEPVPMEVEQEMPEDVSHIFVSSDEYSAIISKANSVRSKLLETDERVQTLAKLRASEEQQLQKWEAQLAGLEKKLTYMETVLARGGET